MVEASLAVILRGHMPPLGLGVSSRGEERKIRKTVGETSNLHNRTMFLDVFVSVRLCYISMLCAVGASVLTMTFSDGFVTASLCKP